MIKIIESILRKAAEDIMFDDQELQLTLKDKDIVTQKDAAIETFIISNLKSHFPQVKFIGEETENNALTNEPTWIIDPIDGTLNFTRNIPQFGMQVAYYVDKEPHLSVIYLPNEDLLLHAEKDQGFYVNHKKMLYKEHSINQSIVTFGDFSGSQPESRPIQINLMSKVMDLVMKTRIYGASSTDFSYVLLNRTQGHFIFSKRLWEFAPGVFMAKEAGLSVVPLKYDSVEGLLIGHNNLINALKPLL